jgi:hypothetical protein
MPRGTYSIGSTADGSPVLASGVAAKIDNKWVRSDNYPHHVIERTSVDETSHARPDMSPAKRFQSAMQSFGGEHLPDRVLNQIREKPVQRNVAVDSYCDLVILLMFAMQLNRDR